MAFFNNNSPSLFRYLFLSCFLCLILLYLLSGLPSSLFLARKAHPFIQNPHNLTLTSKAAYQCFLYDRPQRTGSSTMVFALRECILNTLNFSESLYPNRFIKNEQIQRLFALATIDRNLKRAVVSNHVHMAGNDVNLLRSNCKSLLYVSSTRPIMDRLWSRAKYHEMQKASRDRDKTGFFLLNTRNESVTEAQFEAAISQKEKIIIKHELALENFPYMDRFENEVLLGKGERIVPDYIVRNGLHGFYNQDLTMLLSALGCSTNFTPANQHPNYGGMKGSYADYVPRKGDALYKRLMRIASSGNEHGLRRAAQFAAVARLQH